MLLILLKSNRSGIRPGGFKRILIDIPAQTPHQHHGPGELWVVRSRESRGRARMYAGAAEGRITRTDGTVACGPIWNWSDEQVKTYLAHHKIPINPVYDRLRALGARPERFGSATSWTAEGSSWGGSHGFDAVGRRCTRTFRRCCQG